MSGRRTWTTGDLKRVAELAGTVPPRELRRRLKLSRGQLDHALRTLRAMGVRVTTRCYVPRLATCPSCGRRSATLGTEGICEPCRLERRIAAAEAEAAALLARLPPGERAVYEATESIRESRADPMPPPVDAAGLDAYEAARAEEERDAAMERWAAARLGRRLRAARKRLERIRKKAEEEGVPDDRDHDEG